MKRKMGARKTIDKIEQVRSEEHNTIRLLSQKFGFPMKPLTFLRLFKRKPEGNNKAKLRKRRQRRGLPSYYNMLLVNNRTVDDQIPVVDCPFLLHHRYGKLERIL